jgi:chromosome partitioning protein
MRRICVLNQKGGVGKTTTVANLGACLAELGRSVLAVDADAQANLTLHFGVEARRGAPSLYTLMRGEHAPEEAIRSTVVEGLDIVPANIDLAGLAVELGDSPDRMLAMREALQRLPQPYDYVLVDCPPSLGLLTLSAMCAAEEVFIPLQTHFFALQGVGKLLQTIRRVRGGLNPRLRVSGVIACMFDSRTCLAQEILDEIKQHFGQKVFRTVVRQNVRLAEAPGFGKPITLYESECHGAADYRALAREVLAMERAIYGVPDFRLKALPAPRSMAG